MSETVKQEGDFKIKSKPKMKKLNKTEEVIKVDLSKPKEEVKQEEVTKVVIPTEDKKEDDAVQIGETNASDVAVEEQEDGTSSEEVVEELRESVQDEKSVLEEITDEEVEEVKQEVKEAKKQAEETGKHLPENIEKLDSFMEEPGGSIEDDVRLNVD